MFRVVAIYILPVMIYFYKMSDKEYMLMAKFINES